MAKAPLEDPILAWCAAHQQEIQSYAGQYIAISAEKGIVAHGTDFAKVHEMGIRKDSRAVFELVPDTGIMILCLR